MTTKQLLSSNSYIQYPRFLGFYIGVNEAVLLSALCDKDSLCEYNYEDYNGWFYYIKDEIELDTGLSDSQQRTALKSLIDLNIISTERRGCPSRVYYNIDTDVLESVLISAYNAYKEHKIQWSHFATTSGSENVTTSGSENRISTINKNKNIIINNKSTLPGAPSKNHSQLYKAKATLTDDLESGKSIDEQIKVKKKQTEEERADKKIDKTSYSDKVKELLKRFFRQSYYSKDVKRMKSASDLTGKLMRLDELVKKGEDPIKVVQQSIDMNWNAFYEYKEQAKAKSYSDHSDGIIVQTLSQEEARELLAKEAEEYGII